MPALKLSGQPRITAPTGSTKATSSNVSSSVSGNIGVIKTQTTLKTNEYINTKNAVKILEKYANSNGYIKLYTEVSGNFQTGDTVYITYTEPTVPAGVFNLENPSIPFADYYLGYKVLNTNNYRNEITINRYYTDITSGYTLSNQYLSKISCRGGDFYNEITDGAVFYDCSIYDMDFGTVSGVVSGSTISGATISSGGMSTTSDENGEFSFSIPIGASLLICSADGYVTTGKTIYLEKGITTSGVVIQMFTGSTPSGLEITTTYPTGTTSGAISGGEATGSGIIMKGVCWNTSPNPTIYNAVVPDSAGEGVFISNIYTGPFETTYYVRAYATTSLLTVYGENYSFNPL